MKVIEGELEDRGAPRVPVWSLGERLAKARKDSGLTQAEMAAMINVSSGAVAKWETDRGKPRDVLATCEDWAEITGVDVAWILGVRTGSR